MPRLNSANNANSTLAAGISDVDTTLTIQDASEFPAAPFRCTIYERYPENGEIVEVSAVDGTTFTVTRGMEDTTAQSWDAGMKVGLFGTAGQYDELISDSDVDSSNTADKIVKRDSSGNFSAGTITAALNGNASTASALETSRTIELTGDVSGSASFDGSSNASISATVANNSHTHTSSNISDATDSNTANMIVKRDSSGGFSAGAITMASGNVVNDLVIDGNLTVNGTETIVNAETLEIADNVMVLNSNFTSGTPTEHAGIEVSRGDSSNVLLRWNETSNYWEMTEDGTNYYRLLTTADEGTGNGLDADTLDGNEATHFATASNLSSHTGDTSNPHSVTSTQASYDNTTSGLTATNAQTAIDEVEGRLDTAESNISSHIGTTTGNPHNVTKSDVGLGNVPNTDIAYSSTIAADDFTQAEVDNLRAAKLDDGTTPWTSKAESTDSRFPTSDEKDALAGTGTPSSTNVYVTNDDSRLSDARTPTSHDNTHHSETYITEVSDDTTPQLGGNLDANDKIIGKPVIKDYGEEIKAHGTTGGSITCDMQDGNIHTITLNADTTFTFSNPPASGTAGSFTLMLNQDSTARTVTFPASVKWEGGSVPDLSTVSILYILTFITTDGGTTWYGWLSGSDF